MQCPYCKEEIKDGASKCRYCQGDIILGHKVLTIGCLIGLLIPTIIFLLSVILSLGILPN